MKPSLGILITYYNEGPILRQCLESLLLQSPVPDEILVYDDASSIPPGPHIPTKVKVSILRGEKNHGPGFGRNRLLEKTQCDYVHFHDADDLFHPDWSRRIRQAIEKDAPDVIFTEISTYEDGRLVADRVQGLEDSATNEGFVRYCLGHALLTSSGTYRTDLVRRIGGYRESLWQSEDYDFHVRVAAQHGRRAVLTDPLVQRTRVAGRSGNHLEVWQSAFQAAELLSRELPACYHYDLAEAAARFGSHLFRLGATKDARRAFELALRLGPPQFCDQRWFYRVVARNAGPEAAEWLGLVYRNLFPQPLRGWVRKRVAAGK